MVGIKPSKNDWTHSFNYNIEVFQMNTEKTIQFIKESKGLKNEIKPRLLILYLLSLLAVMNIASLFQGKTVFWLSITISALIIAANIYYFMLRKKSFKYKLFSSAMVALNCVFPVFYVFCTVFYTEFGFKNLMFWYILPFLIITSFLIAVNVALNKKGVRFKAGKYAVIPSYILAGTAILIGRRINEALSTTLSENHHFLVIAFLVLLLICLVVPGFLDDVLRYYCYTKLEKQGLVTEDILKPTE